MDLISQAEYARSRKARGLPGGSKPAVKKAVDTGRITLIDGQIDPDQADSEWDSNTNPAQQHGGKGKKKESYNEALARKETALANLKEMEEAKKRGQLVDREQVRAEWTGMIAKAKNVLLAIGPELCDRLAAETDAIKCREMVDRRVREALSKLAEPVADET